MRRTLFGYFSAKKTLYLLVSVMFVVALTQFASPTKVVQGDACTFAAKATGNWSSSGTWTITGTSCGTYPGQSIAGDTVSIAGYTVTLDVSPAYSIAALTLSSGTSSRGVTFSGTNTLTVTGAVTINAPSGSSTSSVAVGTGTLNAASMSIAGGSSGSRVASVTVSSGTINVSGNISFSGTTSAAQLTFSGAGTLYVGGTFGTGGTFTSSTGTVDFNGSGAQTIPNYTYYNLTTDTGGTKTLGGATTVNGNLAINSGTTLDTTSANNYALTLSGNFTNSGTFNANGSAITIAGTNTQSIAGFTTTGTVSMTKSGGIATFTGNVNGAGLIINGNGGTLNLGSGLTHTFSGTWTRTLGTLNGGSSTLRFGSGFSGTSGTFTPNTGTVEWYASGSQSVAVLTYNNLIFSGSGVKTITSGTIVSGNMSIAPTGSATASISTGANISVGSLTLGGLGTANGTWGSTSSSATYKTNTYFAGTTGYMTVGSDTSINQATLTVTGLPASATYGQTGITAGTSGGSGSGAVTFSAGSSSACSVNSSTGAVSITSGSGTCAITASKAADGFYKSTTSAAVSITVGPASQTISFSSTAPTDAEVSGATYTPTATATSSLTVTLTIDDSATSYCSISSGVVSFIAAGTCVIDANQAGNTNYSAAAQVQQTFSVNNNPPVFSGVAPASSAYVNNITSSSEISYSVNKALSVGTITFTWESGTSDPSPSHTCTLAGTALNQGTHNNLDLSNTTNACQEGAPALVSGGVYDIAFDGKDLSANSATTVTSTNVTFDNTLPVFTPVAPLTGVYINNVTTSSQVSFTVSEALTSGTITVTRTGGSTDSTTHVCTLVGSGLASGTHTINFADTTNGCTSAQTLVSGAIYTFAFNGIDLAGNHASTVSSTGVTFDNTAPVFSSVSPASSAYINSITTNSALNYTLSEALSSGTITITQTGGSSDIGSPHVCTLTGAALSSGTHSAFDLSNTTNGCTVAQSLVNGSIYSFAFAGIDLAGNSASTVTNTGITFDTTAPTVTNVTSSLASGTYKASQVVPIQVVFSEAVVVTGTPQITLSTGSPATTAVSYTSGSGTNTLTFNYTVASTNNVNPLDYASTTALALNSGTIKDQAGNAATLTLATPGQSGSLSSNKTIVIDTTKPTLSSVHIGSNNTNSSGWAKVGDLITLTFTASETIQTPTVTLAGSSVTPTNTTGNTWTATRTMLSTDTAGAVTFNIAFTDLVGNVGTAVTTTTDSSSVTFDKTAPTISIGSPSASYANTGPVTFTVTYADTNFNTSTLSTGNITLNATGGASGTISVTGTGTTRTVTISSITGNGTLGITIAAGTASDMAGNLAPASSASTTFTVDNTAPTVSSTTPANSASGIALNNTVTINWTEANGINCSNVTTSTVTISPMLTGMTWTKTSCSGTTAVFTPAGQSIGVTYTVTIGTGVTDNAGNPMASSYSFSYTVVNSYTSNGSYSWTAPAGVYSITVQVWGGGGKGSSATLYANGGGGGGAYSSSTISVTPGTSYTVVVGKGATSSSSAGGDSSFGSSIVLAKGGSSANSTQSGASGGQASSGTGDTKYSGGNGANGTSFSNSGGGGSSAGTSANGNNASGINGGTAPTGGGAGGAGSSSILGNGTDGSAPGGGSGGGYSGGSSGNGADGKVTITVIYDTTPPTSTISFPVSGSNYNATSWGTGSISGTAADVGSNQTGVANVKVSIKDTTTGKWWNGSGFTATSEYWNTASGTTSWSYTLAAGSLPNGDSYLVRSEAIDNASNTQTTPASATFTYSSILPEFTNVTPANNTYLHSVTTSSDVSYTLNEAITSGSIVITQTGGTADGSSPHTCTLTGTALNSGAHNAFDMSACSGGAPTLVNGAIYKFDFNGTDAFGNSAAQVETTNITFDNIAPSLSNVSILSNNSNIYYAKIGDTVKVTFITSETIQTPSVTIAGHTAIVTNVGPNNWSASTTMLSTDTEGVVAFSITYSDLAGIPGTPKTTTDDLSSVTFLKTTPTLSTVSIASNNSVTSLAHVGSKVTVTFTSSETIQFPTVKIDGNTATVGGSGTSWNAYWYMALGDPAGLVTFTIDFSDMAGNAGTEVTGTTDETSVTLDKTAPAFSAVSPASSSAINSITTSSGVSYTLNKALASGTITMLQTGGASDGTLHTCTLTGDALNSGVHTALDMSDTTNGCTHAQSLVDGAVYTFTFDGTDAAGNNAATITRTGVIFDTTLPSSTISFPVDGSSYNATGWSTGIITGSASDLASGFGTPSGVQKVEVSIKDTTTGDWWNGTAATFSDTSASWWTASDTTTWTYTLSSSKLTDGHSYQVSARTTDNAGNVQEPVTTASFTYDTTAPAAPVVSIVSGYVNASNASNIEIDITGEVGATVAGTVTSSGGGGSVSLSGTIPAGGTLTLYKDLSTLPDGTLTASATLTDAAGNTSSSGTDTKTKDTKAPTVAITTPASGASVNGTQVITFTDDDPNAPQCSVDNGTWVACTSGTTKISDVTGFSALSDGSFTLYLKDTDAAGNTGSTSISLVKDTVAPTVAITAPASGASVNGTQVISFTDDDPNAPQCSVDNATWVACTSGTTKISDVTGFGGLSDGSFTLYLKDTDAAGNTGSTSLSLVKDTVAPKVAITVPASGASVNGTQVISFTDDETTSPQCSVNNTTWTACTSGTTKIADVSGFGALGQGSFTLYLKDMDAAGNTGSTSISLVKDTVAPMVVITAPVVGTAVNGTQVISFTDDDPNAPQCSVDNTTWTSCSSGVTKISDVGGFDGLGQDSFKLYVEDTDAAGNTGTANVSLVKDTVAPVVAITAPASGASVNGTQVITFTDDDKNAPQCSVDNSTWVYCSSGLSKISDVSGFSTLDQGAFTLYLKDTDTAGNTGTANVSLEKDTVAPKVAITAPASGASVNGTQVITFTDDETTAPQCSVDDTNWVSCSTGVTKISDVTGFGGLSDGSFTLYLKDTDAAGNTGSTSLSLKKDTQAPTVAITSPASGASVNGTQLIVFTDDETTSPQCSVDDSNWVACTSGTTKISDVTGFSGLSDASFTLYLKDTDAAGNTGSTSISLVKDTVAPMVAIIAPTTGTAVNGTQVISFTDDDINAPQCSVDNATWTACSTGVTKISDVTGFAGLGQGTFTLYLKDTDAAGNTGTADVSLLKDTVAPKVAITAPTTGTAVNGTQVISFTDDDTNAPQCSVDNSTWTACSTGVTKISDVTGFSGLSDGSFTLYLQDTDAAGNTGTANVSLVKDTKAPTVAITAPASGASVNGTQVISFTDDETTSPQCSVDDTTWVSCSTGVTKISDVTGFGGLSDGSFTLYLKDTDAAGNTGSTSISLVKDTVAPKIAITAPASDASVNGTQVISFTDDETTAPQCSVDDTNWVSCSTGVTKISDVSGFGGLGQGTFTLYLKDTDAAGNTGTTSVNLKKDTVAPLVIITAPVVGTPVNGTQVISFTDDDINAPQCSVDNSTWTSCSSGVTKISDVTGFSGLNQGNFTLYVEDTDAAGNTGTANVKLTKDTLAPTVAITAPASGASVNGTQVITFTDDDKNAPQCSVDNTTWVYCSTGLTKISDVSGFSTLSQGDFTLYLKDTDTAGNTGTASVSLVKDTVAPKVAITSPASGASVNGTQLISFTDDETTAPQCSVDDVTWVSCSTGVTKISDVIGFSGLSDGSFTLYLKDTDAAGNTGSTSVSLKKDTVAPKVAITSPASGALVNGTQLISFTDDETTAPQCSVDNVTWTACSTGVTKISDVTGFSSLSDVSFTLYLKDTDAAGNTGSTSISLVKDTVAPKVAITAPTTGTPVNGTQLISFTDDDINAPQCSVDNATWTACSTGVTKISDVTGFSGLGQGTFTLYLKDTDAAGNTGTANVSLVKDTKAPTVAITAPASGASVNGTQVISFTDDETTSPQCSVDNSTWTACSTGVTKISDVSGFNTLSDGSFTLYLKDTDAAGNTGTANVSLVKDMKAPTVAITDPASGASVNGTQVISFTDTETTSPQCSVDNATWTACSTGVTKISDVTGFSGLGQGTFTLYLKDTDAAGNTGTASVSLKKDTQAPTVAITSPASGASVNGTQLIVFTDDETTSPQCSVNNSTWTACSTGVTQISDVSGFGALSQGTFTLYLKDTDAAGNTGSTSISLVKDTGAPSVVITAPVVGTAVNGTQVISFTDDEKTSPQCSVDNATWSSCTSGTTKLSDVTGFSTLSQGAFTLYLKDTDVAGNTGAASVSLVKDTKAPTLVIVAPVTGASVNGTQVISFTDDEKTLPQCSVDNATWVICSTGLTKISDVTGFSGLSDGSFTLYLKDTDAAGNTGTASVSLVKDTVAPTVAITAPVSGTSVNGTQVISFTDTEKTAPQCSVNDTTWVACSTGVTKISDVTGFSTLSDGSFTLYLEDTDAAGNTGSTSVSLKKDIGVPTVSVSTFPTVNIANVSAVTLSGTCEVGSGTVSLTVADAGSAHTQTASPTCSGTGTWTASSLNLSTLTDGTLTATATQTDAAGNTGTGSKTATKDTQAPTVSVSTFPAVNIANASSVTLSGSCEAGSGTVSLTVADAGSAHTQTASPTCSGTGTWTASSLNLSGLSDGTLTATVTQTDAAGNTGTGSKTATKNTVAPVVSVTTFPTVNIANASAVTLSGSCDATAGTVSLTVADAGSAHTQTASPTCSGTGTWTASSLNLSGLTDGTLTATATQTNAAGNTGTGTKTATKDTVTPVLAITSPASGAAVNGTQVITFTDTESTAPQCSMDNTAWVSCTTGTTKLSDVTGFSGLNQGTFTLYLKDTDAAGNTGTTSISLTKDITAPGTPTVKIVPSTYVNATNKTSVEFDITGEVGATVSGAVTSSGGAGTVSLSGTIPAGGTLALIKDVTGLPDGTLTASATLTDPAGNTSAAGSATVVKDTTAPKSNITFPVNSGSYTPATWAAIAGGASDALSKVNKIEVSLYDATAGKWWSGSSTAFSDTSESWWPATGTTGWTYTLAASNLTTGHNYLVRSRATDNAGNIENPSTGNTFFYPSTDDSLASLTVSNGTLTPTFSSGLTSYSDNVGSDVASLTVGWTVNESNANVSVSINGGTATSYTGNGSQAVALQLGDNTITITVTAQDGHSQMVYTLTVNRAYLIYIPIVIHQ